MDTRSTEGSCVSVTSNPIFMDFIVNPPLPLPSFSSSPVCPLFPLSLLVSFGAGCPINFSVFLFQLRLLSSVTSSVQVKLNCETVENGEGGRRRPSHCTYPSVSLLLQGSRRRGALVLAGACVQVGIWMNTVKSKQACSFLNTWS